MYIIAVDNNRSDLLRLKTAIKKAAPNCVLSCFTKAKDALSFAEVFMTGVAFIESDIDTVDSFFLAKKLKESYNRMNIVFVTKDSYHAQYAFSITASGCVIKPITVERISEELKHLRYPIEGDWGEGNEPFFTIETKDSDLTVQFSSIMCIKYSKRIVTFEVEGCDSLYSKVLPWRFGRVIAPLLEDERFLNVTNNCVINMDWIDKVTDSSFVILADLAVNIPKNIYAEIKEKYNDYYSSCVRQGVYGDNSKEN